MTADPSQMTADPSQMTADPSQMTADPSEITPSCATALSQFKDNKQKIKWIKTKYHTFEGVDNVFIAVYPIFTTPKCQFNPIMSGDLYIELHTHRDHRSDKMRIKHLSGGPVKTDPNQVPYIKDKYCNI
eukprot:177865_1